MKTMSHVSDQSILLALDGELGPREAAEVREHLESCWNCRARREQIEKTINSVVEYHNGYEPVSRLLPRPGSGRIEFISKLDRLIERAGKPSLLQRLASSVWKHRWQAAVTAGAFAVLALIGIELQKPPLVSANELLNRAAAAEQPELRGVHAPVIYRKVRIHKGSETVIRTTYRDAVTQRQVDRMDPPDANALEAAFTGAGFDWQAPLSAGDFGAWRNRLPGKTDEVQSAGEGLLVLSTSPDQGVVQKASLTVRASDWHPIAQQLVLQDSSQLEMTELEYRVVSLDALEPGIFRKEVLSARVAQPHPVSTAVVEQPAGSQEGNLAEAELRSLLVLHRANADAGEGIEVLLTDGGVVVRGMVESVARKQELIAALEGIGHVRPQIQSWSEAMAALPKDVIAPPAVPAPSAPPAPPLLQATLERQFPNVQDRSKFINESLDLAQEALAHAAALSDLGARYGPDGLALLSASSRLELAKLLASHATTVREKVLTERAVVSAIVPAAGELAAQPLGTQAWQTTAQAIIPEVRKVQSDVISLFGSGGGATTDAAGAVAEMRESVSRLEAMFTALADQINSQLLADGK